MPAAVGVHLDLGGSMKRFRPHRPSPSMAVALIALFVALGGTGYAVTKLPSKSVGRPNYAPTPSPAPRSARGPSGSATYPPPPEPASAAAKGRKAPPAHKGRPGRARASSTRLSTLEAGACEGMRSPRAAAAEWAPTPSSSVATSPAAKRPRRSPPCPAAALSTHPRVVLLHRRRGPIPIPSTLSRASPYRKPRCTMGLPLAALLPPSDRHTRRASRSSRSRRATGTVAIHR